MTEMKLSIWTAYYVELSPEDAIREIAKCGYRYAELSDEHGAMLLERGDPTEVGRAFGAFAREMGVEVSQGHLFLKVALTAPDSVAVLCRWLDLFSAIGRWFTESVFTASNPDVFRYVPNEMAQI